MTSVLASIGRATLGPLWLPMLAWTVMSGVALLVLRRRGGFHPLTRVRLSQALLFALPAVLLLAALAPIGQLPGRGGVSDARWVTESPVPAPASVSEVRSGPVAEVRSIPVAEVPAGPVGAPSSILHVAVGLATLFGLLLAVGHLGLIVVRLIGLRRLTRTLSRVSQRAALRELGRISALLGVRRPIQLLEGPRDSVPITFGWRRPVVVVPAGIVQRPDDLRMTLVHEVVHIARADFAWAVGERVIGAVFALHPLVSVLGRRIDRDREASCDLAVVETHEANPHDYAQLLFSLGERARPRFGVAAGLAPSTSHLKERIETMTDLLKSPASPHVRARSTFAAVALLVSTTVLGACFSMERSEPRDGDDVAVAAAVYEAVESAAVRDDIGLRDAGMEAQLDYLAAEIVKQETELNAYMRALEGGEAGSLAGYQRLTTRHKVLTEMYEEHIRAAELLKLEKVAAAATR